MLLTALWALWPQCFFALSQVNHALCHGVGGGGGRERREQSTFLLPEVRGQTIN